MIEFIASKIGFWAFIFGINMIGAVIMILFMFTKLEKKIPDKIKEYALRLFVVSGIVSFVLFLVALGIRAW